MEDNKTNTMTNIELPRPKDFIEKIESRGYKVSITHHRYFGNRLLRNGDIKCVLKATRIMGGDHKGMAHLISGKGGKTEVKLIKGDRVVSAETECSLNDQFVYRTGTLVALKRALGSSLEFEDLFQELNKLPLP